MNNRNGGIPENQVVNEKTAVAATSKQHTTIVIIAFLVVVLLSVLVTVFVYDKLAVKTMTETGKSILPKELVETFEISSIDFMYSTIIFENTTSERKFLFINLKPGLQTYAVQFEGSIKMGISGKDIKIDEPYNDEQKILKITVPKAYIISHDAPLNDTVKVIYDFAERAETARIGQAFDLFNEKKKEIEDEVEQAGLLDRAQESAVKQLEAFLNAIPDIRNNYELRFVRE